MAAINEMDLSAAMATRSPSLIPFFATNGREHLPKYQFLVYVITISLSFIAMLLEIYSYHKFKSILKKPIIRNNLAYWQINNAVLLWATDSMYYKIQNY